MTNGIKPKVITKGKFFNEHTKRYVFYPLHNLDLAGTQATSPVWNPKIPRGRFVLLESCEYKGQIVDVDSDSPLGSNATKMGDKMMGTDAQVAFLMGNPDGAGYMDKGMTHLESLTAIDEVTASEIETMVLPKDANGNIVIPENLNDFLSAVVANEVPDSPVKEIADRTKQEIIAGITTSINYCKTYTNLIEKELKEGERGKMGIKGLSENMKFYFYKINKPLPEDRAGSNMGSEIAKALAPFVQSMQAGAGGVMPVVEPVAQGMSLEEQMEFDRLKAENERLAKEKDEIAEALSAFTDEEKVDE